MYSDAEQRNFIIGAKQVRNILKEGRAKKVYIASDSDTAVTAPIKTLAESNDVDIVYIPTRRELGELCGIGIKTSCAAQTK